MKKMICFSDPLTAPTFDHPRPDRLITGNPQRTTWNLYTSPDGQFSSGIWACEPGSWRIEFAQGKNEFFQVIEGRLVITDSEGVQREFGPGAAGIIPSGFKGSFQVLETVRKHYVVVECPA